MELLLLRMRPQLLCKVQCDRSGEDTEHPVPRITFRGHASCCPPGVQSSSGLEACGGLLVCTLEALLSAVSTGARRPASVTVTPGHDCHWPRNPAKAASEPAGGTPNARTETPLLPLVSPSPKCAPALYGNYLEFRCPKFLHGRRKRVIKTTH